MKTLLEYLLACYLGSPLRRGAEGVSYWPCPVCGHESFHTLPHKPAFKHRAKCWNPECGFRGDAADMLKEFHPDTTYNERLDRLTEVERAWKQNQRLVSGRGFKK